MSIDLAIQAFNSFLTELKGIRLSLEEIEVTLKHINNSLRDDE